MAAAAAAIMTEAAVAGRLFCFTKALPLVYVVFFLELNL
jgi:hypothetical protein